MTEEPRQPATVYKNRASERAAKWARENPEKARANKLSAPSREYAHYKDKKASHRRNIETWPKYIWHTLKSRAARDEIPFDILPEDIIVPTHCPVLGLGLKPSVGHKDKSCSPSVDRKVPEKGYIRGNIEVISYRANLLKNNATVEEMVAVLSYLRKCHGTH